MTQKELNKLVKQLDKHMKDVAAVRDRIDESIDQFEMLREDCDNAFMNLQDARDALSELV